MRMGWRIDSIGRDEVEEENKRRKCRFHLTWEMAKIKRMAERDISIKLINIVNIFRLTCMKPVVISVSVCYDEWKPWSCM